MNSPVSLNCLTEKVAIALYAADENGSSIRGSRIGWDDETEEARHAYRADAKAAIEAMEMASDVAAYDEAKRKLASGEDEIAGPLREVSDTLIEETDPQMLQRLGMDGHLWAKEFNKYAAKLYPSVSLDEGWLIGWFCNAVMAGYDEAERRARSEISGNDKDKRIALLEDALMRGNQLWAAETEAMQKQIKGFIERESRKQVEPMAVAMELTNAWHTGTSKALNRNVMCNRLKNYEIYTRNSIEDGNANGG